MLRYIVEIENTLFIALENVLSFNLLCLVSAESMRISMFDQLDTPSDIPKLLRTNINPFLMMFITQL
jgi:hypothetical protein